MPAHSPGLTLYAQIVAFGGAGAFLLRWGEDEAARWLGVAYLLISSAYAYVPAQAIALMGWTRALSLDAFLPFAVLQFARYFPQVKARSSSKLFFRFASAAFLCLAVGLLLCNWFPDALDPMGLFQRVGGPFYAYGVYLSVPFALLGVAIEFSLTTEPQRNKARLLLLVLSAVAAVLLVYVILYFVPTYQSYISNGNGKVITVSILHFFVICVPVTTAYTLAMSETVRLNVLFTLFVRYRVAQLASEFLLVLPVLVIFGLLWSSRAVPLKEVAVSGYGLMLGFFLVVGVAAYLARNKVVRGIESTFFREPYDPANSTASLGKLLPQATNTRDIAHLVGQELEASIHLPQPMILVKGEAEWFDIEDAAAALPIESKLIWNLQNEPAMPRELVDDPDDELKRWLKESRAELLTPINTASGKLVGAIVSGAKRSGLAYTMQDKDLLQTSARLLLPHLQRILGLDFLADEAAEVINCAMCAECDKVWLSYSEECGDCGGAMLALGFPKRIGEKYEIERRIGRGASGLALLAKDTLLGRQVVLKTLPSVQPEGAKELQKEARSMALVDHPAIATIHGLETWRGLPILVMEYLVGGTLADRIQSGPAAPAEVVAIAKTMLSACRYLHGKGLVHGDIKPSNIGYDRRSDPKLFDFGLARNVSDVVESCLSGTPLYLSPELLAGAPLDERSDLWALSITLYEMAAGKHPIPHDSLPSTLRFLRSADVPPLSHYRPNVSATLDAFFAASLSRDIAKRPPTADTALALLGAIPSSNP